jgi:digeranylgeranylglycerophospholipid reductase
MKNPTYDTLVIGAGPAGLLAAQEIALKGYSVGVLEEHQKVGEPDHCAGLLSLPGLRALNLNVPENVIQNRVIGAKIYAPSGHSVSIERGNREAVVVDRRKFDAWLAERALKHGASVSTNAKVTRIQPDQTANYLAHIQGQDTSSEVTARIIIDAEGSRCSISKSIGFPEVSKSSKFPAYQYEVADADVDDDYVEMYYGRRIAPGFFAWIIPLGEGRARVGLAARNKAKIRLDAAIRHHPQIGRKMKNANIERRLGGVVLVGLPIKRTFKNRFLVVGDAAGMVKATTGGGVVMGGLAARIAGKIVSDALQERDVSDEILRNYEHTWRALLMSEFRAIYFAQKLLTFLSDKGLDVLIREIDELGLTDVVRREGDMDRQEKVIKKLLRDPRMIMTGLKAIRYLNPLIGNF